MQTGAVPAASPRWVPGLQPLHEGRLLSQDAAPSGTEDDAFTSPEKCLV